MCKEGKETAQFSDSKLISIKGKTHTKEYIREQAGRNMDTEARRNNQHTLKSPLAVDSGLQTCSRVQNSY